MRSAPNAAPRSTDPDADTFSYLHACGAEFERATHSPHDLLRSVMEALAERHGMSQTARWLADGATKRRLCAALEAGITSGGGRVDGSPHLSLETDISLTFDPWGDGLLIHTSGLCDFGMPEVGVETNRAGVGEALTRLNRAFVSVISNPELSWSAWAQGVPAEVPGGECLVPVDSSSTPLMVLGPGGQAPPSDVAQESGTESANPAQGFDPFV